MAKKKTVKKNESKETTETVVEPEPEKAVSREERVTGKPPVDDAHAGVVSGEGSREHHIMHGHPDNADG